MAKVVLTDGTNVEISSVLLNKEQNINVSKTYVTTVKKAVTKVSSEFYKIEDNKNTSVEQTPVMEVAPEIPNNNISEVKEEKEISELTNEEIMNSFVEQPKVEEPVVSPEPVTVTEPVIEEVKPVEPVAEVVSEVKPVVEPKVVEEKIEPVIAPTVLPVSELQPVNSVVEPTPQVESGPEVTPTPIIPTTSAIPVSPATVQEPVNETVPTEVKPLVASSSANNDADKFVFDASKETNLNIVLGEVTSDNAVKVEDASPLREFGQSDVAPVANTEAQTLESAPKAKTLTKSKGFANNKFITVIAVLFFIAACVFLGYEIYNYFQIVK